MSWIFLVLVGIDPGVSRLGGEIVSHNTTDARQMLNVKITLSDNLAFWLIALDKLLMLWCPCSPSSVNWYQLAIAGWGQDTVSINAMQESISWLIKLYAILKYVQEKNIITLLQIKTEIYWKRSPIYWLHTWQWFLGRVYYHEDLLQQRTKQHQTPRCIVHHHCVFDVTTTLSATEKIIQIIWLILTKLIIKWSNTIKNKYKYIYFIESHTLKSKYMLNKIWPTGPCISHIASFRHNNLIAWKGRPDVFIWRRNRR